MPFNIKTEKILSASNIKKIIMLGISLKNGIESIEQDLIKEYDTTKTYSPDMAVYYNDYLYRCLFTTTGEFDINSWKKVGDSLELVNKAQVEAMLGLTPDELDTLANIILDSEVRLDKTWSSSKIYESVQAAIRENKTFTLQEFAKANKASYNVVSATSEMTDKSVIYLMSNGSNYDMYIVESDGTPTKIGDTKIDLSSYAKLSDLNNYYDKATSDGKYATITTVDGKVDKTSILSTISSTPSDDKLLSEKAINDTLVKKTDLTTHTSDTDIHITSAERKLWNDGVRRIAMVGSDVVNSNGWYKVAEQTCIGFGNTNITFMVISTNERYNSGILQLQIRSDPKSVRCTSFKWLSRIGFSINNFIIVINERTWTLYTYQPNSQYGRIAFEILSMSSTDRKDMMWTLNFANNNTKETTIPVATVTSSDGASVADVGVTNINPTFPSNVTLGSFQRISYSIKNGWANVSTVMQFASPKLSWTAIATGLPKPDKTVFTTTVGETFVNANVAYRIKTDGTLEMLIGSEITKLNWWNVNFSYPVAES